MEDNARLEEQMQSWEQKLKEAEAEKTRAVSCWELLEKADL
jgi:hypothetical protein